MSASVGKNSDSHFTFKNLSCFEFQVPRETRCIKI